MDSGIPSALARLEAALTSPAPTRAAHQLADHLADPPLLGLLFGLMARRLVRTGPQPPDTPTPAGLVDTAAQLADDGRLPVAAVVEIRRLLDRLHAALVAADAWRPDRGPWWGALPEPGAAEALFTELDESLDRAAWDPTAAFAPESTQRWVVVPGMVSGDRSRSLHDLLEAAYRAGHLDLEPGAVGIGARSAARQDSVNYLHGFEESLFPHLLPLAVVVQWCRERLLPRLAAAAPLGDVHPPATVMLARYAGPSAGYRAHLDNPGGAADNGRRAAVLLYLNHPDRPCRGGRLALWSTGASTTEPPDRLIAPDAGTLAMFDSCSTPHEVRPLEPGPARWSLAMWLHAQPARPVRLPRLPAVTETDALLPVRSPPLPAGRVMFHEVQQPEQAGALVVRRAAAASVRAGVVATVFGAGADLHRWCRHHLGAGFAHLVLVFDRLEDPEEAVTAAQLGAEFSSEHLTIWSSAELRRRRWSRIAAAHNMGGLLAAAAGGATSQAVAARQALNATAALEAARSGELGGAPLDWLVHLDADELFYLEGAARGGAGVGEHFATLSDAEVAAVTYLNHELLLPAIAAPRFKLNPRLALARLGSAGWPRLAEHLAMTDAHPRPYFSGYRNGKAAVAVAAGVAAAGVHGWQLGPHADPSSRRVLAGPSILHYRFAAGAAYCAKYEAMAAAGPPDTALFEMGRADGAALEAIHSLGDAAPDAVRAELLRLRDALTGFGPAEADLLDRAGLLLTPDLSHGLHVDTAATTEPAIEVRSRPEPRPRTVGVLGGGTAGYLAALALRTRLPALDVTLIESRRHPVIGVGEATTPLMPQFLHADLGLDVHRFFAAVGPTFKLGIRFEWGEGGAGGFNYPFGAQELADAQHFDGHLANSSLQSMMMARGKLPVYPAASGWESRLGAAVAYHVENRRFVAYLAQRAREAGVTRLEAEIRGAAATDPERGIEALITTDGGRLTFDVYADCSGFASVLMGDALGSEFVGYQDQLPTDRAVVAAVARSGNPAPYTLAEAMAAGWCWNAPQPEADHRGYVYASAFSGEEEAVAEMRRRNPQMDEPRVLRFRPGRRRHFRRGNVFALGNAYGFVEPLESTALHMLIRQIGLMLGALQADVVTDTLNRRVGGFWDYLAWFLAIHFRFNRRLDTPFWRFCRSEVDVSRHAELLTAFGDRGPLSADGAAAFGYPDPLLWGPGGIDTVLLGQDVSTPLPAPQIAHGTWKARVAERQRAVEQAAAHADALAAAAEHPEVLDQLAAAFTAAGPAFPVSAVGAAL